MFPLLLDPQAKPRPSWYYCSSVYAVQFALVVTGGPFKAAVKRITMSEFEQKPRTPDTLKFAGEPPTVKSWLGGPPAGTPTLK